MSFAGGCGKNKSLVTCCLCSFSFQEFTTHFATSIRCVQGANLFERMVTALVRIAQTPATPDAPTTVQEDERALRFLVRSKGHFILRGSKAAIWNPLAKPAQDESRAWNSKAASLDGSPCTVQRHTCQCPEDVTGPARAEYLLAGPSQLLTFAAHLLL